MRETWNAADLLQLVETVKLFGGGTRYLLDGDLFVFLKPNDVALAFNRNTGLVTMWWNAESVARHSEESAVLALNASKPLDPCDPQDWYAALRLNCRSGRF